MANVEKMTPRLLEIVKKMTVPIHLAGGFISAVNAAREAEEEYQKQLTETAAGIGPYINQLTPMKAASIALQLGKHDNIQEKLNEISGKLNPVTGSYKEKGHE
jgi:hypothetical protein